ncbi:putative NAD kinase 2, chloroplastic [Curcuma longa]|uniref:putative NAD kinase 2, chloroplastic n=1 Tax=Curcuma longa TaxID=136217 RepID=UPI003D9ED1C8
MLAICAARAAPVNLCLLPGERSSGRGACVGRLSRKGGRRRRAGRGEAPPHRLPVAARARLTNFFSSPIGLDSQTFQTQDVSQMLWIGPVPGDIAEVEAYCRIFRAAEQLHSAIMDTLCNAETGVCAVPYDIPSEEMPMLEDKIVAILGCMLALLNRAREDVLSGRSSITSSFRVSDITTLDGKVPPLAAFRSEMKRCCESLQVALASVFTPIDDRSVDIWRRLQRLKNVCYDAGFARADGYPCPTIFANWGPVYFSTRKEDSLLEDSEIAFWRGGQLTVEGLTWLLENGFKTIVNLREEASNDEYYLDTLQKAVSHGKIELINLPVEVGTAPSIKQVEQFAMLVEDPNQRPIYLHSREGVGRTSAMISRWRQYITRSSSVSTLQSNFNGKAWKNTTEEESLNPHNPILPLPNENTSLRDDLILHSSSDVFIGNKNQGFPAPAVENQHEKMNCEVALIDNSQSGQQNYDTNANISSNFSICSDPLRSQFPTCNILSRKEMITFFRSREFAPKTYMKNLQKKSTMLPVTSVPSQPRDQANGASEGLKLPVQIQSQIPKVEPTDGNLHFNISTTSGLNGKPISTATDVDGYPKWVGTETTEPNAIRNMNNSNGEQVLSITGRKEKRKDAKNSLEMDDDPLALGGDMCASATGVVRLQSRRKAEMYLVRTDGFSCTREKVTESSLAFTHPSTQQQMLMWKSPPKTVLLLKKLGKALMEEAKEVALFLYHQEKMNVLVEPDVHDIFARIPGFGFVQTFYNQNTSDLHERVDFVVCLGGDGVILHASNLFRGAVPPVVSFNLGSLGFLTSHPFEEHKQDLRAIIYGNNTVGVYITLRMRLRCEIFRSGKAVPGKVFDVLNEVVVDRGSNPYLCKVECYEHNRLITKVQGDGVIVATPTGSTAYSTAAGGSMVHPNVPCMLFTPICPHSLSFRPVILPDSAQLEMKIPEDARNNAWVSFDGKRRQQLSRGDSIRIAMSQHPLPTVNKSDQTGDWFRSLIRCLNWNERKVQKGL